MRAAIPRFSRLYRPAGWPEDIGRALAADHAAADLRGSRSGIGSSITAPPLSMLRVWPDLQRQIEFGVFVTARAIELPLGQISGSAQVGTAQADAARTDGAAQVSAAQVGTAQVGAARAGLRIGYRCASGSTWRFGSRHQSHQTNTERATAPDAPMSNHGHHRRERPPDPPSAKKRSGSRHADGHPRQPHGRRCNRCSPPARRVHRLRPSGRHHGRRSRSSVSSA
jgi:hypothetical protein